MKIISMFILLIWNFMYAEDIQLSNRGGVYYTPVTLNNSVRLEFVVDTGATLVSMPIDVFMTLFRTGTINKSDILRPVKSKIASGEITEGLMVNLRELKIGSQIIYNVKAFVGGINDSLLLGQSALRKLEPWSLNTRRKILRIRSEKLTYEIPWNNKRSNDISNYQITTLIDNYISRGNSRDIYGVMELYANMVNYFNYGVVSKNFIYKDINKYYARWPSMQIKLIKINSIKNYENGREVTYTILFDVYNYSKRKGILGKAVNTMILKKINGSLKIISDKQKVLFRKKY